LIVFAFKTQNDQAPVLTDELHWLPVYQRISYKIALMVYRRLHSSAPAYMSRSCCVLLRRSPDEKDCVQHHTEPSTNRRQELFHSVSAVSVHRDRQSGTHFQLTSTTPV
jgi:hypothetical protein